MGSPWARPWLSLGRRWLLLLPLVLLLVLLCCLDPRAVRGRLGLALVGLGGLDHGRELESQRGAPASASHAPAAPARPARPAVPTVPPEVATGFLVDTPGCRIPFLAPLDEAVRPFVFPVKRVHCEEAGPALVEADAHRDVLHLRRDRAHAYNVSDPARLACCGRAFWRPPPPAAPTAPAKDATTNPSAVDYRGLDDAVEFADNCTDLFSLADEAVVSDEFVRVECSEGDAVVYRDVFGFTPSKPQAARAPDVSEDNAVDVVDPDTPKVSILIVGADSVSRSNLLRQMPQTVELLKDIGAVDMLGYNKVEDNTFPNLVALLTGLSVPELRARCWPSVAHPFDDCPFLWRRFEALGYRTAYAEDEPWMGIFNYIKNGFARQPVHYYMRPYARLLLKELGHHQEFNCHLCTGARFQLQALLDYAARFARLPDLLFGLFWGVSLTHDQLNNPQLADPLYSGWLRAARDDGVLDRSVVVFLSDHGIRWGDIRETYQGRLEERLPFLMISLPRWLRDRYPSAVANLRRNSRRLVTPYDLHATLEDLMDLSRLEQPSVKARAELLAKLDSREQRGAKASGLPRLPRAISMFLVAPESRSCEDAGIEPHWCTCYASTPVAANHTVARRAAAFVVRRVNAMLSGYRQCERLNLSAILDARRQQGRPELGAEAPAAATAPPKAGKAPRVAVADYSLLLRTEPGGALFEATVRVRAGATTAFPKRGAKKNRELLSMAGTISRVNRYGAQSSCVADYHMKLYCFCRGFQG